jgi:hypothetical protein
VKTLDQLIDWKQEYENLRREALQADSRRGHGLALFLSHGMMAWLEADGTEVTSDRANCTAGIVRSSVSPAARSDHVIDQHGFVLHEKRGA